MFSHVQCFRACCKFFFLQTVNQSTDRKVLGNLTNSQSSLKHLNFQDFLKHF